MAEKIGLGAFMFPSPRFNVNAASYAREMEELGFDGLWIGETPNNRGPAYDTFTLACQAAFATSRITIGTAVTLTPLHQPFWLAKQWGTLDNLSNGRVILTLGVGGEFPKQFEVLGLPVHERGARTNETIEALRALWVHEPNAEVSYHGRFFNFDGITCDPVPTQKPHPPLLIGGRPGGIETGPDGKPRFKSKTGAMLRAAKYGDGWNPYYVTVETYKETVNQVKAFAAESGRKLPDDYRWYLYSTWTMADSYDEAVDKAMKRLRYGRDLGERVKRYDILGTPKDCIQRMEEYIDAGCRYFIVSMEGDGEDRPKNLHKIAKEIIPHLKR